MLLMVRGLDTCVVYLFTRWVSQLAGGWDMLTTWVIMAMTHLSSQWF